MPYIEVNCSLDQFREFMIRSTCFSFMPHELRWDRDVFPERAPENGTMYVEAEDKHTVDRIADVQFVKATNVLGVIYNSKSGSTRLKWRHMKGNLGKLSGEASTNSLANLYVTGIIDEEYVQVLAATEGQKSQQG